MGESVSSRYWPLFDLRLRVGNVELRPTVDADLTPLAGLKPADVELDPARPSYGDGIDRGSWTFQSYWRSVGNWRPESWKLECSVYADGALVGVQCLEGDDFARMRTVDSSSWLITEARGRGIGKAMRLAVLALAFDGLGAEVAVTEAWQDNASSLGVSRSLGYAENGSYRHARDDSGHTRDDGRRDVDEMVRLRLDRDTWLARHRNHSVMIENLEPCLPLFGITGPLRALGD
jgi:RimJ/RimL family protein N-acetyltransferase